MAQRGDIPAHSTEHRYSTRDTLAVLSVALALDTHDWVKIASLLRSRALGSLQDACTYTKEDCQRIYQLAVEESRKKLNVVEAADSGIVLGNALGLAKRRRLGEIQERLRTIDSQIAEIDASSVQAETEDAPASTDSKELSREESPKEEPSKETPTPAVGIVSSETKDTEHLAASVQSGNNERDTAVTSISERSEPREEEIPDSAPAVSPTSPMSLASPSSPVLKDADAHTDELYMTPEEQPSKDAAEEPADGASASLGQKGDQEHNAEKPPVQQNGSENDKDDASASYHSDNEGHSSDKEARPSSPGPSNQDNQVSKDKKDDATAAAIAEDGPEYKDTHASSESEQHDKGNDKGKNSHEQADDAPHGSESKGAVSGQETPPWPKADTDAPETSGRSAAPASSEVAGNQSPPVSASSSKSVALTADEQQLKNWKKNITTVWREISGHRYGGMFIGPIKSADAPNYYDVIRKPMDLKMIKNRIRDEEITTTVEFYRDIMHMLMNALMYNSEDTEIYQMTMEMIRDAQACIEQLLQTEATVNKPKGGGAAGASIFGSGTISVARSADGTPVFGSGGFGHGLGLGLGLSFGLGLGPGDGAGAGASATGSGAGGASLPSPAAAALSAKGEQDTRPPELHHETEDSDSSLPAKRRRRMASERASKNLRA